MIDRGISFDDIHSYYDLDLILSKVEITPAVPREEYIDIAGGDGSLDLTEAHGEVKYKDREGCKFVFTMNPSGCLSGEAFEEKKTEVSNALNGKSFNRITLDKDPGYYYTGRCVVDEYASDKRIHQITVKARLKPYKYKQNETVLTYSLTDTETTVTVRNARKTVVPEIVCTDDNTTIKFGSIEKVLSAGRHKILDIQFKEGLNVLNFSGSGTITLIYQEGDL